MRTSMACIGKNGATFPVILLTTIVFLMVGSIVFVATPTDATGDEITVTTYEELKGALDAGHNVKLESGTLLEGDVQLINPDQYIYLDSGAKYKGTVTYNRNSITLGSKDYITAVTDCIITAGESLEIDGTFGSDNVSKNIFIKITGGSVKATGGIKDARLEVLEDSALMIETGKESYVIDNSQIDINGKVFINGNVFSRGSINIGATGTFNVNGMLENYWNIDNEGSITVNGTVTIGKYGESPTTITNKGTLINNGTISITGGTFDGNPIKNGSRIELDGESTDLTIENIKDGAEVDIKSILCKTLMISNSIGDAHTDSSVIRIVAEHFTLGGLKIVSKIRDSARYNDMSGIVNVTDQMSPLDHDANRDLIECASIHADGHLSIDGELSLPKGVTLRVGYNSDHTVFDIDGTFVTDGGQITAEIYKDESKTDTESVTGRNNAGGIYLKNTEITITGKYTAYVAHICIDGGDVSNYASYQIDDVVICTSLSRAVDECSKSGRDCWIWAYYKETIDDDMLIPDNITLNVIKGITIVEGKTLIIDGTLIFGGSSTVDDIIINGGGSMTVLNEAELSANELRVFGSLSSDGFVVAERILVGISDEILRPYPVTLGAATSVSGHVSATEYWVVAAGSDVSGVNFEGCKSTSYIVEDVPYVTLYAESPTCIGIITTADREEAEWIGWYAEGGSMTDVSNDSVGDYSTVCAMFEDDIVSENIGITAKDCLLAASVVALVLAAIALIARVKNS